MDIGFYGHNHAVQRHSSVLNGTVLQKATKAFDDEGRPVYTHVDPPATIHMVIGTAGAFFTKNALDPVVLILISFISIVSCSSYQWKFTYIFGLMKASRVERTILL